MSGTLKTGKLILTKTTSNNDAFDRLRVSNPSTLFEINHCIGKLPFLIDEVITGSGASTAVLDNSYIAMTTIALSASKVIRQSYEYVPYQPGKSRMMLFSGVLNSNWTAENDTTGIIARIGCFDDYVEKTHTGAEGSGTGLFFELNNKTLSIVERLNRTVSVDGETRVAQTDWNYDKFDGTGPSGLTVNDFSNAMIFVIDQEWLGVGRVRFGFFINGTLHIGHILNHSGLGTPTSTAVVYPYTKTAKLPIRYEITSTGASTTVGEMRMMCSTVLSEGGYEPTGMSFSIGRLSAKSVLHSGTPITPIIAIKLLETEPSNRKSILLKGISILNSNASKSIQWDLYIFPNDANFVNSGWTTNNSNNSVAQYNINPAFTGGIFPTNGVLIDTGYADSGVSTNNFSYIKYLASPLVNSSIIGQTKVLCLCAIALTNNCDIHGSLNWIEII